MDVSVIIQSLNGKEYFKEFLPSIIDSCKNSKYECEIIVIDDKSEDDSVDYLDKLQSNEPLLRYAVNPKKGTCSGRNYGASISKGKYLLFLDNDVMVEKDFIDKMIKYFSYDNIGMVASAGYQLATKEQIDGIKLINFKRGFFRFTKNILNKDLKKLSDGEIYYSFGVQGAYQACRRDLYLEVFGMSELFEPYLLEETDLFYKIVKRGYKVAYASDTKPLHKWGGTIASKVSERTKYLSVRNRYIFNFIHLHSLSLYLSFLLMIPYRLLFKNDRAALKEIYSNRKAIKSERNREKSASVKSDIEILNECKNYAKEIRLTH